MVLLVGEVQGDAASVVLSAGSLYAFQKGNVIRVEGRQQGLDSGRGEGVVLMQVGVVSRTQVRARRQEDDKKKEGITYYSYSKKGYYKNKYRSIR